MRTIPDPTGLKSPESHHCWFFKILIGIHLQDISDSKRINYHLHSKDGGCPELITQV